MKLIHGVLAAGVALILRGGPLVAQVPGLPVFHEPFRAPVGVDHGVQLVTGHARTADGHDGALSWTLGGRYRIRERVIAQAMAGMHYPESAPSIVPRERSARPQFGGAVDVLLVRRTLTAGAFGGVGYGAGVDGGVLTVPVGLGATWFIPVTGTGAGPKVGVWGLPRGELLRRSGGGTSETDLTWGASWGVSAVTGAALGFNLGVDYRSVPEGSGAAALPPVPEWSLALLVRLWR